MSLSLDQFRTALLHPQHRQALGISLSDDQARLVVADPQSSQSWYAYWLSIGAPEPAPAAVVPHPYAAPAADAARRKSHVGLWVALSVVVALFLIVAAVAVFAFTSARHWTKTDVPAMPETFHSEEYETGLYEVEMDTVNPCAVKQDWTDCTNAMARQYEAACTGVELTVTATSICANYSAAIDEMKRQDGDGYYVETLGTYGHLTRTPEMSTREVSNNDGRPAKTHQAVCYLGFIGECR